jgi:hypothetical protein
MAPSFAYRAVCLRSADQEVCRGSNPALTQVKRDQLAAAGALHSARKRLGQYQSSREEGPAAIQLGPGDHLPGIPAHKFKAGFDYWVTREWKFGMDVVAASSQFLYGDEANLNAPLADYAKVSLHTSPARPRAHFAHRPWELRQHRPPSVFARQAGGKGNAPGNTAVRERSLASPKPTTASGSAGKGRRW